MKKLMLISLAVVAMAGLSPAQDYAFVAHNDEGWVLEGYRLTAGLSTNPCADIGTNFYYRVLVSSNEYAAGWDALSAAKKAAAKAAAKLERGDLDKVVRDKKLVAALALVTLDEINLCRQWVNAFKGAVANSVSLADLKTRVAALPDMPDRTAAQLKSAVNTQYQALNP